MSASASACVAGELPRRSRARGGAQEQRRLHVLFVADHLGHAGGVIHGASRYYVQVLPRLDRERFHVQLCILGQRHAFAGQLEAAGVEPIFLERAKWDVRALRDLDQLVRRERVDVLHCLAMKGCLLGRVVGMRQGVPAIIHLHDTGRPGMVVGTLQRRLAGQTARALAVSDLVRTFAIDVMGMAPEKTEVLHNGLDVEWFASPEVGARKRIRRELSIEPGAAAVLLAGRVVAGKGQRELISAWPRVLQMAPGAVLVIAGEGADLPACREAAKTAGVEHTVRFVGQRQDMPDLLSACDLATMPSLAEEGFGYAALEAAAAGKAVVAFDTGALREIVEAGVTGEIVPPGDLAKLAAAIGQLAGDEAKRREMGRRGGMRAQRFGIAAHVRRLEDLYREVAGVGGGRMPRET